MPATEGLWPTAGCFDNIRILEVGDEKGEFCGRLLSNDGADVIKIEPAEGSPSRRIGPFYQDKPHPESSLFFWMYNRGKRGVTLNLSTEEGRELYLKLAETAEVILDAHGVGVMDGLHLGYERVREVNPDIIYCSITPFGLTGPWRDLLGSDLVHTALGGPAYTIGYNQVSPGKWDTPPLMPQTWHSFCIGGQHAAMAIMAALVYWQRTGHGQFIDVSIHDACAQSTEATIPRYIYYKNTSPRTQRYTMQGSDGMWLTIMYGTPANMATLAQMLHSEGIDEGVFDSSFTDGDYRKDPDLMRRIDEQTRRWVATQPAADAFRKLQEIRVPNAPAQRPEDLLKDPHSIERQDFVEIDHPELGRAFTYPRHPRTQSVTPSRWGPRAPLIGEHTSEVLSGGLGLSDQAIKEYRAKGVL